MMQKYQRKIFNVEAQLLTLARPTMKHIDHAFHILAKIEKDMQGYLKYVDFGYSGPCHYQNDFEEYGKDFVMGLRIYHPAGIISFDYSWNEVDLIIDYLTLEPYEHNPCDRRITYRICSHKDCRHEIANLVMDYIQHLIKIGPNY